MKYHLKVSWFFLLIMCAFVAPHISKAGTTADGLPPSIMPLNDSTAITKFGSEIGNVPTYEQPTIFPVYDLASVRVVDNEGNPLSDAEVHMTYVLERGGGVYRIDSLFKNTDSKGLVTFKEKELRDAVEPKIGKIVSPYPVFLMVFKKGYMDTYVNADPVIERPVTVSSKKLWEVEIQLLPLEQRLVKQNGQFSVNYYPGQELCADVALQKLQQHYLGVFTVLGKNPSPKAPLRVTFDTHPELSWDWIGGGLGIETKCHPWTKYIADPKIQAMWDDAIPHELLHTMVSSLFMTYWTNEGLAQYTMHIVANRQFSCDPNNFLPVQDLTGENMPYYETASCFWKGLEDKNPGFVKTTINRLEALSVQRISNYRTRDFISMVLVPVLVQEYHYSHEDAENFINGYMGLFHYDPNKD